MGRTAGVGTRLVLSIAWREGHREPLHDSAKSQTCAELAKLRISTIFFTGVVSEGMMELGRHDHCKLAY